MTFNSLPTDFTVYIAPRFFETELKNELRFNNLTVHTEHERFFLVEGAHESHPPLSFAQNVWLKPFFIPIESVGHAAKELKAIQRNWHSYPLDFFRRVALIEEKLPPVRFKPLEFGTLPPQSPLGAWTLWDKNTLLVSASCSSAFAHGECIFQENKIDPPSRAYLKLWETFTLFEYFPKENDLAIDLGACPGGWTWVMANQGAKIFAIDKAPLDARISLLKNVDFCRGSGFSIEPKDVGHLDWLLSDMACYPEKLYDVAEKWIESATVENIIFTLKLQGETDFALLEKFRLLPNSKVTHLSCNKHELTWVHGKILKSLKIT